MIQAARRVLGALPVRLVKPVFVVYGGGLGDGVHAGTDIRQRRIVLQKSLANDAGEFRRILIHELFHLAWVRLANPVRWSYEELLGRELDQRARGELGWSAEWRKRELQPADRALRTRKWRCYVCESFCDTAAWRWSGLSSHDEFTLAPLHRKRRKRWIEETCLDGLPL